MIDPGYQVCIPSYSPNLSDESHCLEACVKMVLETFETDKEVTYEDAAVLTGKLDAKSTYSWPLKLYLELANLGYQVKVLEDFDYHSFSEDPDSYMINTYGEEVGYDQIRNSDLEKEAKYARILMSTEAISVEKVVPDSQNIIQLLSLGYLLICNVNQKVLQADEGYIGHFILIYGFIQENGELTAVYTHNPGPPFEPEKVIRFEDFDKAWSYPSATNRNILAIRKD